MQEYSIYINIEDAAKIEEEEASSFIRNTLISIGIDLDEIWPENKELNSKDRIILRRHLAKLSIDILYDGDRGYKIYWEDNLIAEWFKPLFILKKDTAARKVSDRIYYEMIVKYESLFEEDENE